MAQVTFRLYTYDVWGNEEDGFEVNDVFRTGETYTLPHNIKYDSSIIMSLQRQGLMKGDIDPSLVEIDGDEEVMYFSYDGKPEFELRKEGGN